MAGVDEFEWWRIFSCISFGDGSHISQPGGPVKCWYSTHLWETGRKKGRKLQATCLLVFYSDYVCMQLRPWHGTPVAPLLNIPSLTGIYQNSLVDSWVVAVELLPKYGEVLLMYEDLIL